MTIWLERFVLTALATVLGATVLTNPWNLDRIQQLALIAAIVAMSVFTARTVERLRAPAIGAVSDRAASTNASSMPGDAISSVPTSAKIESNAGTTSSNSKGVVSGGAQRTSTTPQSGSREASGPSSHMALPAAASTSSLAKDSLDSKVGSFVQPKMNRTGFVGGLIP